MNLLIIIFLFVLLENIYQLIKAYIDKSIVITKNKEEAIVIDKREFRISEEDKRYVIYLSCYSEYGKAFEVTKDEYESIQVGNIRQIKIETVVYKNKIFYRYKLINNIKNK